LVYINSVCLVNDLFECEGKEGIGWLHFPGKSGSNGSQ